MADTPRVLPVTMHTMERKFRCTEETTGAFKFVELLPDGRVVPTTTDGQIGQIYIRKSALPGGFAPKELELSLTWNVTADSAANGQVPKSQGKKAPKAA